VLASLGLDNRSNWYVVGLRGMEIFRIRVVRGQGCAHLMRQLALTTRSNIHAGIPSQ
jgi:hypothetical protein